MSRATTQLEVIKELYELAGELGKIVKEKKKSEGGLQHA
jgi:hypothetical protein